MFDSPIARRGRIIEMQTGPPPVCSPRHQNIPHERAAAIRIDRAVAAFHEIIIGAGLNPRELAEALRTALDRRPARETIAICESCGECYQRPRYGPKSCQACREAIKAEALADGKRY